MNRRNSGASVSRLFWMALVLAAAALRADDPVPITVQLDWKPGLQFAGLLIAQERGWYREAGLDVTIRANDFRRPYTDVVAEDDHAVGTSEARTLVTARSRGAPVRALATMFQASPVALISLRERGLRTTADFEGKTLGIHRPEDIDMLKAVFGNYAFRTRIVGFEFRELLAGEVDAATGYVMDEPIRLAQGGTEVNVLPLADCGWTDYAQVIFASEACVKKNPEAIRRFIVATFRGWRAVLGDPAAVVNELWRKYPSGLSRTSARESLLRQAPLLTKETPHPGVMCAETWKQIIGLTPGDAQAVRAVTVENLVDFRFQPDLEESPSR